jgi:hypothetical protein
MEDRFAGFLPGLGDGDAGIRESPRSRSGERECGGDAGLKEVDVVDIGLGFRSMGGNGELGRAG